MIPPHLRNPWKGIDTWKEFKYDMRHPILLHKRGMESIKGNNPDVSTGERFVGAGLIVLGFVMFVTGFVTVILVNLT